MTISLALAEPPTAAPLATGAICSLPALIDRARTRLAEARTSAEVLEARAAAKAALHYAKLLEAANETQADCLSIIKRAELRMADEIDTAQQRGEVARREDGTAIRDHVRDPDKVATYPEIGISRQRVAEWRELRDAGESVIDEAIQAALDEGRAPTNADVQRAVEARHHRTRFTGENEWYTPPEYIEAVRACLGAIDVDPASSARAQETVRASRFFTRDNDGLRHDWHGRIWLNPPYSQPDIARFVDKLLAEIGAGRVRASHSADPQLHRHRLVSRRRREVRRDLFHARADQVRERHRRDRGADPGPSLLLFRRRASIGSATPSAASGSSDDPGERLQPAALGLPPARLLQPEATAEDRGLRRVLPRPHQLRRRRRHRRDQRQCAAANKKQERVARGKA